MKRTFTANTSLSALIGFLPRHRGNVTTIDVGSDAANDFGGGTLTVIKKLQGGDNKTVATLTAVYLEPVLLQSTDEFDFDIELTGATNPNLTVQVTL